MFLPEPSGASVTQLSPSPNALRMPVTKESLDVVSATWRSVRISGQRRCAKSLPPRRCVATSVAVALSSILLRACIASPYPLLSFPFPHLRTSAGATYCTVVVAIAAEKKKKSSSSSYSVLVVVSLSLMHAAVLARVDSF